ncbi:hypothetical protein HAX54_039953 [Datura stramonium]|uniref:Uncharacterized protein n=1 Tax=Datura stramonium TaxID=4076 RepID=A0ABS8SJU1_DATST|nr:hypothetical protein [Datura stramonium]
MSEVSAEGSVTGLLAFSFEENGGGDVYETMPLIVSASFIEGKSSRRMTVMIRTSLNADEFFNLLHGSDQNEVKGVNNNFLLNLKMLFKYGLMSLN